MIGRLEHPAVDGMCSPLAFAVNAGDNLIPLGQQLKTLSVPVAAGLRMPSRQTISIVC